MLIVIAGIKRSGSTAQFNIVRIALETAGYTVNIQGQDYKLNDNVNVVKIHPFRQRLAEEADYIFLTDRDDKEIEASLYRFNGDDVPDGKISKMRTYLDKWKQYKHCMCGYYLLETNPKAYVKRITD